MRYVILVLAAVLALGCSRKAPPEPIVEHAMVGEVMRLDPPNQLATIRHEAIKDFMGAMTMDYTVRDKDEFDKLHVGDKLNAIVFAQGGEYWVGRISIQPTKKP